MSDPIEGLMTSLAIALGMTSASPAQECIRTLPQHRDAHWYYYVRKSDGAHCWFPGAPGTHVAARSAGRRETNLRTQPESASKLVAKAESPGLRKASPVEAEAFINATALQFESVPLLTRLPTQSARAGRNSRRGRA